MPHRTNCLARRNGLILILPASDFLDLSALAGFGMLSFVLNSSSPVSYSCTSRWYVYIIGAFTQVPGVAYWSVLDRDGFSKPVVSTGAW